LCSLYTDDAPAAPGTHLALFADDTCIYARDTYVVYSANCNAASLQSVRDVTAGT
jgi:hypothetical protein